MKQPRLKDLKINRIGTEKIRAKMRKGKRIKITINIDAESLIALKAMANDTGMPYQRLLNALLKDGLKKQETTETRLQRIEQELKRMKRKFAA